MTESRGGAADAVPPSGVSWVLAVADLVDQVQDEGTRVRLLAAMRAASDERMGGAVAAMRAEGASWQDVADAVGTTRQSAWERFGRGTRGAAPHPPGDRPAGGTR